MEELLLKSKEIKLKSYMFLNAPIFKGQTAIDDNLMYWVVVESKGILYKMHCKL